MCKWKTQETGLVDRKCRWLLSPRGHTFWNKLERTDNLHQSHEARGEIFSRNRTNYLSILIQFGAHPGVPQVLPFAVLAIVQVCGGPPGMW